MLPRLCSCSASSWETFCLEWWLTGKRNYHIMSNM
jgi:hypothetical protein